jgi:hypothetical protein
MCAHPASRSAGALVELGGDGVVACRPCPYNLFNDQADVAANRLAFAFTAGCAAFCDLGFSLADKGCAGLGRELPHTTHARHIPSQVEIVRLGGSGRFSNDRRQMEGGGIEHCKLSVQQIDQF